MDDPFEVFCQRHNIDTDPEALIRNYPRKDFDIHRVPYEDFINDELRERGERQAAVKRFIAYHNGDLTMGDCLAVLNFVHLPPIGRTRGLREFANILTKLYSQGIDGQVRERYMWALAQDLLIEISKHTKERSVSLRNFTRHLDI